MKKGLIAGIIADIIPIVLSALTSDNITNSLLRKVVLTCYSIRFELVIILVILLTMLLIWPILKKLYAKDKHFLNTSICIMMLLFSLLLSFGYIKHITVNRLNYFRRDLYLAQIQSIPFDKGQKLMLDGEFENAKDYYRVTIDLQPNGYYSSAAKDKIDKIDRILEMRDHLSPFFKPIEDEPLQLTRFRGLSLLQQAFPGQFDYYYNNSVGSIQKAILNYSLLYEAVDNNDFEWTQTLIKENGWCWFEQTLRDKFSSGSKPYLMGLISEYIHSEPLSLATERLCNKWNVSVK